MPDTHIPLMGEPHFRHVRNITPTYVDLNGKEHTYVRECLDSGVISSASPFVTRFEEAFACFCGTKYALTTSQGTTAITLALKALGVGVGDEVIVPELTMVATANAVLHLGAKPVIVDVDRDTWNINPRLVAEAIGERTAAIIAVHLYGLPVDWDNLSKSAGHIPILEDASQAHGASFRGRRTGSLGDIAAFSLYANKILTTGEGGIITTSNKKLCDAARKYACHDMGSGNRPHFLHEVPAFNYSMGGLQAAIGLAQVERADELLTRRRELAHEYERLLGEMDFLQLPITPFGYERVWWYYPLLAPDRNGLRAWLASHGVWTRATFIPLSQQPYLQRGSVGENADFISRNGLYLPLHTGLSNDDIQYVGALVREYYDAKQNPTMDA